VVTGRGNHRATGATGGGHLRASDADREQAIEILKDGFVQGLLTKDELGLRAGQALGSRTRAQLTAITAGIPALTSAGKPLPPTRQPARQAVVPSARQAVNRRMVVWAGCLVILVPLAGAAFATFYGGFIVLFLLTFGGLVAATAPRS
jgi:Domain of unknown function (DUF1707)